MRHLIAGMAFFALVAVVPCLAQADDEAIAKEIVSKLRRAQESGAIKGFSVDLEVDEGAVWMKGRFSSQQHKDHALRIAQHVRGVTQVVDDLEVQRTASKPTASKPTKRTSALARMNTAGKSLFKQTSVKKPETPSEPRPIAPPAAASSEITDHKVAQLVIEELRTLKDAGKLKDFRIDVDVTDGSVWIKGDVASASQRTLILETARRVKGVRQVVNDIAIATKKPAAAIPAPETTATPIPQVAASPISEASEAVGTAVSKAEAAIAPPQPIAATLPAVPRQPIATEPQTPAPQKAAASQQQHPATSLATAPHVPAGYVLVPIPQAYAAHGGYPVQQVHNQTAAVARNRHASQAPLAVGSARTVSPTAAYTPVGGGMMGAPAPMHHGGGAAVHPAQYEHPQLPGYAWPSYASYPNYGAVTYPKQHSAAAWPYIGPFYPYPQVPLGWRKVQLQWDDGWWFLDFKSK